MAVDTLADCGRRNPTAVTAAERLTRPGQNAISITLHTYSHAIPAMQEEAAVIAGLVFSTD